MSAQTRTLVIVNQAAARAGAVWPIINRLLGEHRVRFDTYMTTAIGDATARTREALLAGYRIIGVVGGDGTLGEAASGFFDFDGGGAEVLPKSINPDAALALLPAGTGDDFARGLAGGARAPLEQWTRRLIEYERSGDCRRSRPVDVIHGVTGNGGDEFICLNASTLGIGAEVAGYVAGQGRLLRTLPGEARFASAALRALLRWRERRMTVTIDGAQSEFTSNLIAVTNGVYAGGGMMFAPSAKVDDALMDVMLAGDGLTRRIIMRELPRIRRGDHLLNPRVRLVKASTVRIEPLQRDDPLPVEADGNLRGQTPAVFRVLPRALRIVWRT